MTDPYASGVQFSPATQAWFDRTFAAPTDAQRRGWEAIGRGDHTLILAPTGSGKTLAAFLWALDRLAVEPGEGCRVLYVSPLKALTYDVARNLEEPLAGIRREAARLGTTVPPVQVAVRTGDTSAQERRLIARRPPDVLATTPESLYLLLTSKAASILASVEHVIVDEIHAVAGTKRGSHLALSLERLEEVAARPPQRIGLSATQRPLEELARFLGGFTGGAAGGAAADSAGGPAPGPPGERLPRPVTVVDAGTTKQMDVQVAVPVPDMADLGRSGEVGGSIWPAIYPELLRLVRSHRSTLIFVNSRRLAERLAARLNELAVEDTTFSAGGAMAMAAGAPAEVVRAHHGSMSREQRTQIESALKAGTLPALVATSSLELGIDMGAVDLVVQVEAPTSVASGLQRIGRSGHRVGEPSKGRIFPKFRQDLLVSAVVVERMRAGLVEETRVPRNALDVLAQQVVATVAAADGPVPVERLAALVRRAYPYSELPEDAFHGVLDMLSGRYPSDEYAELKPRLVWDRVAGTLEDRPGARVLAVTSGGTIPDRGLYGVFTSDGVRVGELDEEMVYECRVGETFLLGATTWRIREITRDRVTVDPAPGMPGRMPFWHGDTEGRPLELGEAVGRFTRTVGHRDDAELARSCGLEPTAAANVRAYIDAEKAATGGLVPTDRQVVLERFRDELGDWRVALLSPFGARVHGPWALAVEARLRRSTGPDSEALWSDDGIMLRLPGAEDPPPLDAMIPAPDEVEQLVVGALGRSALFAARFRENAARSLLLPRRRPGQRTPLWQLRLRAADLLAVASRHESFPVLLETYRECLQDVFDLPGLVRVLSDVAAGRVTVAEVELPEPSPFASGLVFAYVAQFMYEGDAPMAERRAQALTLDRRMLAELLGTDELRDLLDAGSIDEVEAELQALSPGRRAAGVEAVADLLRRLGDLSLDELAARCDPPDLAATAWKELASTGRATAVTVAGEERLIAVEDASRYRDGLGIALPPDLPGAFGDPAPDALVQLVRRWARTHGPFVTGMPARRFGIEPGEAALALGRLAADGRVVRGGFRPGGEGREEWCDSEVLRAVRRRSLAALRREVEPVDPEILARFLPLWQGLPAVGAEPPAGGASRLLDVVAQLEGLPLPAGVLEADILGPRVQGYETRLLDELLAGGEIMWVGAGAAGARDGRIVLARRDHAGLVLPLLGHGGEVEPALGGELHDHVRRVLTERGACFFRELGHRGASDADLLDALWDLVWAGEVTCDGLAALRVVARAGVKGPRAPVSAAGLAGAGALPGRRLRPRPGAVRVAGPPAGQGRWSLVRRELGPGPSGLRGEAEAAAAVASALLDRHGVLTREAVRFEGVRGGFSGIYPVLKALEESGRARRGYFLAGMGAAQFALPGAVDRLRSEARPPPPSEQVHVMAAADPANPYGAALPWPVKGPARAAGAHLVLVAGRPALFVERGGHGLVALRPPDGSWEEPAVRGIVAVLVTGRRRRLVLRRYPPELTGVLQDCGFVPGPKGMVRYP